MTCATFDSCAVRDIAHEATCGIATEQAASDAKYEAEVAEACNARVAYCNRGVGGWLRRLFRCPMTYEKAYATRLRWGSGFPGWGPIDDAFRDKVYREERLSAALLGVAKIMKLAEAAEEISVTRDDWHVLRFYATKATCNGTGTVPAKGKEKRDGE